MPVPGNHDVYDSEGKLGGEDVYREVWGDLYYSWDYRNAHFIVQSEHTFTIVAAHAAR